MFLICFVYVCFTGVSGFTCLILGTFLLFVAQWEFLDSIMKVTVSLITGVLLRGKGHLHTRNNCVC